MVIYRDNVEWNEEQESHAMNQICQHLQTKMSIENANELQNNADRHWEKFYSIHQEKYDFL